jgi:hypothetical protein
MVADYMPPSPQTAEHREGRRVVNSVVWFTHDIDMERCGEMRDVECVVALKSWVIGETAFNGWYLVKCSNDSEFAGPRRQGEAGKLLARGVRTKTIGE